MNHNHHGHGAFGLLALVGAIAFAFGVGTARTVVQITLLSIVAAFAYVMWRVLTGSI